MPGKAALQHEDCISGRLMDIPQALFIKCCDGNASSIGIANGNIYATIRVI